MLSRRLARRDRRVEKDQGVRESSIEHRVCERARENGWLVRKLAWIGRRGAPDRLFMKGGVAIFVEFKQSKKKAAAHQNQEHVKMRAAGMYVLIIDNVELGYEVFR
jgi:hypothetical protein